MTPSPAAVPHSRGWVAKLAAECWQQPGLLIGALAATAAGTLIELAGPLLVKRAIDSATSGNTDPIAVITATLVVLALIKFAFAYTRRMLAGQVALGVQHRLRLRLLAALQRLDGRGQDQLRTGQVVSRSISDLQQVQGLLAMVPLSAGSVLLFGLALAVMMVLSPLLGLVALAVMPLLALVVIRVRPRLYAATWTAQQTAADLAQHVEETVTGVRVVKGFGQESRAVDVLERLGLRLYARRMRAARIDARLAPALMVIPLLAQVGVIALGGWLVLRGSVSVGTFLAFSAYLLLMSAAMRMISSVIVAAQLARAAVERVFAVIESAPATTDPVQPAQLPSGPLSIEFRSVTFGYDAAAPVLRDFSMTVSAGETVAVIGPAGSGKSTLALLLPRLYIPDAGTVSLSGIDLTALPAVQVREAVAVVFDDPFLFSDTIAANIALGRPDAPLSDIQAAARAAAADEFIGDLPDGYSTVVGERGLTLSGGQRQRIALARALLLNPRVLVLDDATSAVDAQTEAAIFAGLAAAGRTTLILAHRESTLEHADRIVRLPPPARLIGQEQDVAAAPDEPPGLAALPAATERPGLASAELRTAAPDFRLRQLLSLVRWPLAAVLACLVVDALAVVAFPALTRQAIDAGALAQSGRSLAVTAGVAVLLVVADFAVLALATVVMARAGERVLFALRVRSYAHLQRLGLDYYEREMSGRIMTRMTTDVDALSTFIQTGLSTLVVSVLMVAGVSVALVLTDPGLGLIVAGVLPLLLGATLIFRRVSGRAYNVSRDRIALVNSDFQENVTGLRVSQAYRREEFAAHRFARRSASYQQARMRAQRAIATYFPLITALSDIALAVVLYFGARQIAAGAITPGTLVAFVLYLGMLFGPIQQLTQVFDGYQQASVGLRRIGELLRTPSSIEPAAGAAAPGRLRGEVSLDTVGFRYRGAHRDALDGVSLHIPAGSTVALVGRTGAGKSTVMKLLARFYDPTTGSVSVDGVDVRRYQLHSYRTRLGVVPQEAHLFTGDVGSNIAFGKPGATDTEIRAAASAVGAADLIDQLPLGLRTPVGERGRGLSAGQRQLIALARAELVDPDVLLLDEATATLDPESEQAVLEASRALARKRTAVIVAHRLATAARADLIVVVEGGRVTEIGTHAQLLTEGRQYASLWAAAQ